MDSGAVLRLLLGVPVAVVVGVAACVFVEPALGLGLAWSLGVVHGFLVLSVFWSMLPDGLRS